MQSSTSQPQSTPPFSSNLLSMKISGTTKTLGDLWAVDDGYSVDKYYTRATDNKGHGSTLYARMLTDVAEQIAKIVQSNVIPEYKTHQDFIRDAIYHRLRYLSDNGFIKHDDVILRIRALEGFMREEQRRIEYEETLKLVDKTLSAYISHGAEGIIRAKQVIDEIHENVIQIQDAYWAKRYTEAIAKFEQMIKN